jgi:hypothetical protein
MLFEMWACYQVAEQSVFELTAFATTQTRAMCLEPSANHDENETSSVVIATFGGRGFRYRSPTVPAVR